MEGKGLLLVDRFDFFQNSKYDFRLRKTTLDYVSCQSNKVFSHKNGSKKKINQFELILIRSS